MTDKFEKRGTCLYCEQKMEAEYRNKKFCSNKCRVYWNRENNPKQKKKIIPTSVTIAPNNKYKKIDLDTHKDREPSEGSMLFFKKYGVSTYAEIKDKK